MQQFAYHLQRRLSEKPSTINYFHSTIPDTRYVCFHPKSLFGQGKDGPIAKKVAEIAKQLRVSYKVLSDDITHFLQFAPYSLPPSAPIRLLTNAPVTPFTTFLKPALLRHPPQVIHSLRHGKDKITAPSFFFSFWVSHYTIRPYFAVRLLPFALILFSFV